MTTQLKHRIVGTIVLLALLAILLPMLFGNSAKTANQLKRAEIVVPKLPVNTLEAVMPVVNPSTTVQPVTAATSTTDIPGIKITNLDRYQNTAKKLATARTEVVKPKAWAVQLGSFANAKNAQKLVSNLRKNGLNAYTRDLNKGKLKLTQVFVGPEIKQSVAKKLQKELKQKFSLNAVVVRYQL